MNWRVSDVSDYLDLSEDAIRKSSARFKQFLSAEAVPSKGRTRVFAPRDVAILQRIHELTGSGHTWDDAEQVIQSEWAQGTFDHVEDYPDTSPPEGMIPISQHLHQMGQAEAIANQALQRAKQAEEQLQDAQAHAARLEGRIEELEKQIKGYQADMKAQRDADEIIDLKVELRLAKREIKELRAKS